MNETVSMLMQRNVWTIKMDDPVEAIKALFTRERLSWAPVVSEEGVVVGVISATDLVRHLEIGKELPRVMAWQLCTYKPIEVAPDTTLKEVAGLMVERKIHHVVVMEHSKIVGVVSSLDFVRAFIDA